jgi:hypothetical protein
MRGAAGQVGTVMARPAKQTVEYFPHYVQPGKTLFILESKWGNVGYAFWFKMLEVLGESDGHVLRYNEPDTRDYFLARCGIQHAEAVQIFSKLVELKKIDRELWESKEWVWCPGLIENLRPVYSKRTTPLPVRPQVVFGEKTQFPGRKQKGSPMNENVSGEKTPHSRVEERKGGGRGVCIPSDNDIHIDLETVKDKTDAAALSDLASPGQNTPEQKTAPTSKGIQFPEADILDLAKQYCLLQGITFHSEEEERIYLRSTMFYPAKDLLAVNQGRVERAKACLKHFSEFYTEKGFTDWHWKSVMEDFKKWDEPVRKWEAEQEAASK